MNKRGNIVLLSIWRGLRKQVRPVTMLPACLFGLSMLCALPAQADIYGYRDADGTVHVSTEKLDARYQLFMRGDASFDASQIESGIPGVESKLDRSAPLMQWMLQHPNLKKYENVLNQNAREFSVEPALLKAIMAAESGFNPTAVSPKGAIGLMQIMPDTAERYGVQGDRRKTIQQKLSDPAINIRLAARYLKDLMTMFPQRLELAIASYNAGEGAVQKYNNQIPPYPETRNYVQLVAQFYQLYQPPGSTSISTNSTNSSTARRLQITLPGRSNMPPKMSATTPTVLE